MVMISTALIVLFFVLALLLIASLKSFGINREYQRAVLFRLGRLGDMKGPGWYWLIPFVDRVVRVDQRIITYQLETQETITRDGVAVRVNAVLWFRADSPIQVVTAVEDWRSATVQAAETALRDAIGQSDLDHMLKDRASINERLQQLLREASLKWGVEIDAVEIKDVDIPEQMQRAIAKEAEAIREKRARIIRAEGEQEAATKLAQAAQACLRCASSHEASGVNHVIGLTKRAQTTSFVPFRGHLSRPACSHVKKLAKQAGDAFDPGRTYRSGRVFYGLMSVAV